MNKLPNVLLVAATVDDTCLEAITIWKQEEKEGNVIVMLAHPAELFLCQATEQGERATF